MEEISLTGATLLDFNGKMGGSSSNSNSNNNSRRFLAGGESGGSGSLGLQLTPLKGDPLRPVADHQHSSTHAETCKDPNHNHSHQPHQQQQQQQQLNIAPIPGMHPRLQLTAQQVIPANNRAPCCEQHGGCDTNSKKPTIVSPSLTLAASLTPTEFVQQESVESILQALFQIVRMGPFPLFQSIVDAWIQHVALALVQNNNNKRGTTANPTPATTRSEATKTVFTQLQQAVDAVGGGHSMLHWATKRVDDLQFVNYLAQTVQCPVDRPSQDATNMTPMHWSCTLPTRQALPVLRILIQASTATTAAASPASSTLTSPKQFPFSPTKVAILEVTDSTGCTPLLIAAQHGHVETVAYLVQMGANVQVTDTLKDSAVHWAAYKGSLPVLGLLSYYKDQTESFWTAPDVYGQMPLHLAALRGHTAACRYILRQLKNLTEMKRVLYHEDSNGRTPLKLAIHKQKLTVAAVLQAAMDHVELATTTSSPHHPHQKDWKILQKSIIITTKNFFSAHSWKVWLGVALPGDDSVDESPRFPFYYVCSHFLWQLIYVFIFFLPIFDMENGVLWDYLGLQCWNLILWPVTIYLLYKTNTTNPGRLDDRHPAITKWRRLYEWTLEQYAIEQHNDDSDQPQLPPLCHTCHIARPIRSKHDRYTAACIEVFDHHCPFVGASIGLYNYRYFITFMMAMTSYFVGFWFLLFVYARRTQSFLSGGFLLGVFLGVHGLMPAGMLLYHIQLSLANLTTNEHIQARKYDYLWQNITEKNLDGTTTVRKKFRNPWNKGWWNNIMDRMMPSEKCYYLDSASSEQVRLLQQQQHQQQQDDSMVALMRTP